MRDNQSRRRAFRAEVPTPRRLVLLLFLQLACASLFSVLYFLPGTQSFVLVPFSQCQRQNNPPSSDRRWKQYCSAKTALFDHTISGEQRRQPTSRGNNRRRNPSPAALLNEKLVELGKKRQWSELLEVAEEEQVSFNNVNYATAMSQLGRIRSFNKKDPRFVGFLKAMATKIEEQGLPWIQARPASNIVHAIGKMQLRNPSTKRILEWISQPEIAAGFVGAGNPHDIANVAWACATLGFQAPNLFAQIEHRSKWLVEEGNPQGVANVAWACATLGVEAPNLFAEIECQSKWLVEEGTPQNVANAAWACATLGFKAPNLFVEIEHQSKWLVETGNTQDVANTAWACATLGFEASELFIELDQHADRLIEHGNPQEISNTCYAIAVLGKSKAFKALLAKLWERAINLFNTREDFLDEELRQLAQTTTFAEADGIKLPHIPERMAKKMDLVQNTVDESVSRSFKEVSQLLNEMGFRHKCEVAPDSSLSGGMLAIDFACLKQMIAIEFDGPSHFLKAVGSGKLTATENGATKAKRRYLEQLGWTVINIDYRDYIQAHDSSQAHDSNVQQWLRDKLLASGVTVSK